MKINYRWTFGLCGASPILLLLVIFFAGGGYGTYAPTITLFPFAMLGIQSKLHSDAVVIALAIVQLPIYGITLDVSNAKGKFKSAALILAFLHIAAVVLSSILQARKY